MEGDPKPRKTTLAEWVERIDATFEGAATRALYVEYVSRLNDAGLPILFDTASLADVLGLRVEYLQAMAHASERFYRSFEMPKRSGGFRTIDVPSPALLFTQRWILEEILSKGTVHEGATGFLKGVPLVRNAIPHLGAVNLLKMDLEGFFPSIPIRRVIAVFMRLGYSHKVGVVLASLCCKAGVLPQGAPTSPQLSNLIANRLDKRLSILAKKLELRYTRYADDIALSGVTIRPSLIALVEKISVDEGFRVNHKKTVLASGNSKKVVTGISVCSDKPRLPRSTKRLWRAEAHSLIVRGWAAHCEKFGIRDPLYLDRVIGRLNFWKQIEPDNRFVSSALESLKISAVTQS